MHDNDKTMTSMKHNGKPIIDDEGIFSISSPKGQMSFLDHLDTTKNIPPCHF